MCKLHNYCIWRSAQSANNLGLYRSRLHIQIWKYETFLDYLLLCYSLLNLSWEYLLLHIKITNKSLILASAIRFEGQNPKLFTLPTKEQLQHSLVYNLFNGHFAVQAWRDMDSLLTFLQTLSCQVGCVFCSGDLRKAQEINRSNDDKKYK